MGRNTAFSATQAADALNYMALAGYDTQTSMEMLPNVLNLAAAGSMDLARASDMVTDTQTAFGISLERTSQMVDEMAKAASTGNTSVEQLGDAFLVVGGLAQEMNGGMVELSDGTTATYDNIQELEIALTAMANAGIKGSEAGTHMRNMLLKLASPTKEGVKAFEELGVTVFDSEGKMRSLSDLMGDLNGSLSNLTQEQKLQAISDIFNTRDTAAAEALLNAVGEDWDNIAESILDAEGAAQQMADTQLDNLAGDITLFQSALEGAKIAVSDGLTPTLREFVKFGTDGLSRITSAFQEGGITGAMAEFGTILSDGIAMITDMLPDAINAGMELLGAVGQGILDNLPTILDAAKQILLMLGQGIMNAMPSLLKGAMQIIKSLGGFLVTNAPLLLTSIIEIVTQIATMLTANAEQLVDGAIALLMGLGQAFIEGLPILLPALLKLATAIAIALVENLPVIIQSLIEMTGVLVQTIVELTPQFINACVQVLMAIVGLIVEYGGQFLASAGEVFGNLINSVGEWMGGLIDSIVTWLSQLPTQMAYWAGFAIGSFIQFFMDLPENLKTWFNETKQKAIDFGTEFRNEAINSGKNFFNGLVDNIKQLPSRLVALGNSLVQAIANLPSRFMEVGKNIVTCYNGRTCDTLSFLKQDMLGLNTLSIIKDTLNLIGKTKFDFDYDLDDPNVYNIINKSTLGIFQLEGPGATEYTQKLQPSCFDDLVADLALVRPGAQDSGDADEFLKVRFEGKPLEYDHPLLEGVLKETNGCILYQEQAMAISKVLSGFTDVEADTLRKGIGKKLDYIFTEYKPKFINGAIQNGVEEDIAELVWNKIEKASSYSFNKSHAVGYALISYQTAYLKTYYPIEYYLSLLNNTDDEDKRIKIYSEIRSIDKEIINPDINISKEITTSDNDKIYLSFPLIKGVGEKAVEKILEGQPYSSYEDFCNRCKVNRSVKKALIQAGAFDCFGENRNLLYNAASGETDVWSDKEVLFREFQVLKINPRGNVLDLYDPEEMGIKKELSSIGEIKENTEDYSDFYVKAIVSEFNKKDDYAHLSITDGFDSMSIYVVNEFVSRYIDELNVIGNCLLLHLHGKGEKYSLLSCINLEAPDKRTHEYEFYIDRSKEKLRLLQESNEHINVGLISNVRPFVSKAGNSCRWYNVYIDDETILEDRIVCNEETLMVDGSYIFFYMQDNPTFLDIRRVG